MITDFNEICAICNKQATETHHLLFGTANRRLADQDGLTLPLCREHHQMVHKYKELQILSEIVGQLAYEKDRCEEGMLSAEARVDFMSRYGRSYL